MKWFPPRHRLLAQLVALISVVALIGGVVGFDRWRDARNTRLAHRDAQILQQRLTQPLAQLSTVTEADDQPWCLPKNGQYQRCWVLAGSPSEVAMATANLLLPDRLSEDVSVWTPGDTTVEDLGCYPQRKGEPTPLLCQVSVRKGRALALVLFEDERLALKDRTALTSAAGPTRTAITFAVWSAYFG